VTIHYKNRNVKKEKLSYKKKSGISDEIVDVNGVKILGDSNLLNKLPVSASNLYSKNLLN